MDSDFTTLFKRFIDCYEGDPAVTDIHLWNAHGEIYSDQREEAYEGESKAKSLSRKRTRQALKKRLILPPKLAAEGRNHGSQGQQETRVVIPLQDFDWQKWKDQEFEAFLDKLAWSFEMPRSEFNEWAVAEGYTKEQLASVMRDPKWLEKEREHSFAMGSRPDFQVFFAKEFADWLDTAAGKLEGVDEIFFRDSIPLHLKQFLHEAYRCDLYGLNAACTSLCGAILQEAIRFKLDKPGFSGLDEAIRDAGEANVLIGEAEDAARRVKKLRDIAAHGKQEFEEKSEEQKKSALPLTRIALDSLFARES